MSSRCIDRLPEMDRTEQRPSYAGCAASEMGATACLPHPLLYAIAMADLKPVILDARSWLEAATGRYVCSSYRFGDIYVRDLGGIAIFASQLELEATMDEVEWSGRFWVTDLWKKGRVRRGWRLAQRVVSLPDDSPEVPAGIRALQLWH